MVSPRKELQQYGSCGGIVGKKLQIKNKTQMKPLMEPPF
jgi:hypothetical protein